MSDETDFGARTGVRRHLLLYLDVRDRATGGSLGRLGDITRQGLLIVAKEPLDEGAEFRAGIVIPDTLDPNREMVDLTMQVRWCRTDTRPDMYAAGCVIADITPEDREYITALIERIGFSDGTRRIFLKNDQNVFTDPGEASKK